MAMEWNDHEISALRTFWAEGVPVAQIGARVGRSKNAVVGKAHRLLLEPRPNPISPRGAAASPRRVRRTPAATLPPIIFPASPIVAGPAPPAETPAWPALRPNSQCCWPIGEPGTPRFRFCDGAATPGRPYCDEHAARAYTKASRPQQRRDARA